MVNIEGSSSPYTDYFDPLVALVTHLSATDRRSRTIPRLARDLAFPEADVRKVLEGFRGLFRRSSKTSKEGEYFYTVHLRYARRPSPRGAQPQEGDDEEPGPLDSSEISALLQLISSMVSQEKETSRLLLAQHEAFRRLLVEIEERDRASTKTRSSTLIAASIAAIAAIIAAFTAAVKSGW